MARATHPCHPPGPMIAPPPADALHRDRDEVVLVMASPGVDKGAVATVLEDRGHVRIDRRRGALGKALAAGLRRLVVEGTFPTHAARARALSQAREAGLPARCVWLDARPEVAHYHAALRAHRVFGRMPTPEELASRRAAGVVPSHVVDRYARDLEPPGRDEGFDDVIRLPVERAPPHPDGSPALLLDLDGTLRRTRGPRPFPIRPDEVELLPGRREVLARWLADGYRLFGVSNQAGVALGQLTDDDVRACAERTVALLGLPIDVRWCPHPARPVRCWCRKPLPGMGVELVEGQGLDPGRTIMVGDRASDEGFARALGVSFAHAEDFFR